MVRIRMKRMGRTHRPFYRINAIDSRTRRDGRVIEQLGWYNPCTEDESQKLNLNEERIRHWLSVGAQPSETVRDILAHNNLLDDKARARWEADRKARRERTEAAKAASAEAPAAE